MYGGKYTMKNMGLKGGNASLSPAPYPTSGGGKRKTARKARKARKAHKSPMRYHKRGGLSSQLVPLGLLTGLLSMGPKRKSRKSRSRKYRK